MYDHCIHCGCTWRPLTHYGKVLGQPEEYTLPVKYSIAHTHVHTYMGYTEKYFLRDRLCTFPPKSYVNRTTTNNNEPTTKRRVLFLVCYWRAWFPYLSLLIHVCVVNQTYYQYTREYAYTCTTFGFVVYYSNPFIGKARALLRLRVNEHIQNVIQGCYDILLRY